MSGKNESGQAIVYTAMVLTVLAGFAAIAVDAGRLVFTGRELQTIADSTALAGAHALVNGSSAAITAAVNFAPQNPEAGTTGTLAASDVLVGTWNGSFSSGGSNPNALQTSPSVTANNILPLWTATTTLHRTATAAFLGSAREQPTLPIALAKCSFTCGPSGCDTFTVSFSSTGTSSAGWFYPSAGDHGKKDVEAYIPSSCGGNGKAMPTFSAGATLNLDGGDKSPLCNDIAGCLGMSFILPVVDTGDSPCHNTMSGSFPIVGFATVTLTSASCSDSLTFSARLNDDSVGAPGTCTTCGTGRFVLVQ
jgi:Flp pilus assembly protein TadG